MAVVTLQVPTMWADHHTLRVRQTLADIKGIERVEASAAARRLIVHYQTEAISPEQIEEALVIAGYDPNQVPAVASGPKRHQDGSPWYTVIGRETQTLTKDREMAGDFRRY